MPRWLIWLLIVLLLLVVAGMMVASALPGLFVRL